MGVGKKNWVKGDDRGESERKRECLESEKETRVA